MSFSYAWDVDFNDEPADSDSRRYGAQQIRKLKDAIAERMQIDHEFSEEAIVDGSPAGTDSLTDTGYHKRVTLKKVAGGPSEAGTGYTELGYNSTNDFLEYYPAGGTKAVLATEDETQTLTNKTLTSPVITGGTLNGGDALTVDSGELNQLDGVTVGGTTVGNIPFIGGLCPVAVASIDSLGNIISSINVSSCSLGGTSYQIILSVSSSETDKLVPIATAGASQRVLTCYASGPNSIIVRQTQSLSESTGKFTLCVFIIP